MTQDAESDLRELVAARRTELKVEAEELSWQLQEVRGELKELSVAERVVRRLVDDKGCSESVA